MTMERTLSIIKPDAVSASKAGAILQHFEDKGLKIVASRKTRLSIELHHDLLLQDIIEQLDLAESTRAISDDEEEPEPGRRAPHKGSKLQAARRDDMK